MLKPIRPFFRQPVCSDKEDKAHPAWERCALVTSLLAVLAFGLIGCATPAPVTTPAPGIAVQDIIIPPSDKIIRYAVFPAPPYMIGVDDEQAAISGIDVAIVQEIARRLGREVVFVRCPWVRCLELMKNGDVDLVEQRLQETGARRIHAVFQPPLPG